MPLSGFPDILSFNQRSRTIVDLRQQRDITSIEAVTGQRVDVTEATNGQIGEVQLLRKGLSDVEQSRRLGDLGQSRIDIALSAVSTSRETIGDLAIQGQNFLTTENAVGLQTLQVQAETILESVFSNLNIRHGSRALFSGDATNAQSLAPVENLLADVQGILAAGPDFATIEAELDTYFDDPAGGFQTLIYQGGDGDAPPLNIDDNLVIDINIRADNQAFKDTIQGLALIASAGTVSDDVTSEIFGEVFQRGIDFTNRGQSGLINLDAQLGVLSNTIENALSQNETERIALEQALDRLIGRDQFDAVAELTQLEVALESAFIITSRISNLTLANFLN